MDQLLGDPLVENRLGEPVGEHRDRIEHLLSSRLGLVLQLLGDLLLDDVLPICALEAHRLHGDQIHHAGVIRFEPDGDLHRHRVVTQLLTQPFDHPARVGAGAIELVDQCQSRNPVAPHLAIHGDRLGLHPRHPAEHQDRAVEHAQGALHLHGEVHVSRCIDQVDVMATPLGVGRGGGDGDAPLPLQLHVIHGGASAVLPLHLVNPVNPIGVEEDPLGEGGLARIDVGADAEVANLLKVTGHDGQLPAPPPIALGSGRLEFRVGCTPPAIGKRSMTMGEIERDRRGNPEEPAAPDLPYRALGPSRVARKARHIWAGRKRGPPSARGGAWLPGGPPGGAGG